MGQKISGYEHLVLRIFDLNQRQKHLLLPFDEKKIKWLEKVLLMLSPREESVLRLRYGLGYGTKKTLQQAAKEFGGVSRQRVSDIEKNALDKMRQHIGKKDSRFVRDEQGKIIAHIAFLTIEREQLLIQQKLQFEDLARKNTKLLEKVALLAEKSKAAIDLIEAHNISNENLEKLKEDLKKFEEALVVFDTPDLMDVIGKLRALKNDSLQLREDCNTLQPLFGPLLEESLITDEDVEEFLQVSLQIIPVFNLRVEELDLSVSVAKRLRLIGVETLGQLVQKTRIDLLKLKGFGYKSLAEIHAALAVYGLSLGMKHPGDFAQNK